MEESRITRRSLGSRLAALLDNDSTVEWWKVTATPNGAMAYNVRRRGDIPTLTWEYLPGELADHYGVPVVES